jgi:hypothetical protein
MPHHHKRSRKMAKYQSTTRIVHDEGSRVCEEMGMNPWTRELTVKYQKKLPHISLMINHRSSYFKIVDLDDRFLNLLQGL